MIASNDMGSYLRRYMALICVGFCLGGCGRIGYKIQQTRTDASTQIDGSFVSDGQVIDMDAQVGEDSGISDAGFPFDFGTFPGLDAARSDASGPCPTECNGGCDLGVCTVVGSAARGVASCPDGIPCRVVCTDDSSCTDGVVCGTGPCQVLCAGPSSCRLLTDCTRSGQCDIECSQDQSCSGGVTCGTGFCSVNCSGSKSCRRPVDCGSAAICNVSCGGTEACNDVVQCRSSRCDVQCAGSNSCPRGLNCATACACSASCSPSSLCGSAISCPAGCSIASGCTTSGTGCDMCP